MPGGVKVLEKRKEKIKIDGDEETIPLGLWALARILAEKNLKVKEIDKLINEEFKKIDKMGFDYNEIEKYVGIYSNHVSIVFNYPNDHIEFVLFNAKKEKDMTKQEFALAKENYKKLLSYWKEIKPIKEYDDLYNRYNFVKTELDKLK
jgi:hypothetical protein